MQRCSFNYLQIHNSFTTGTGPTTNPAMLQALLIWAVFATSLPPPTSQSCFKAKETQCRNVDFAPGSHLAGEGFDITTMQRKGAFVLDMSSWLQKDKSCTLCKNRYMGDQKQKLPISVVDWRPSQKCSMKVSGMVYQSSESLVSASTSSIENNWKLGLQITIPKVQGSLILAGSNSKLAEYSMEKTKKDKFSFTSHDVSCGYYSYRVSSRPVLHPELKDEFRSLPAAYDNHSKHLYYKLIDKFGTHYITKVTLGGEVRSVTSIKECEASLQGLSVDEVKMCLDVEASVSMGTAANLQTESHHCKQAKDKTLNKKSFASSFSDRETNIIGGHTQNVDLLFSSNNDPKAYKEWVSSLPTHPDVLSYSLEPLHELLPTKKPNREHLRNAIKDYILQRGLWKNCTSQCKTGVKTDPKEPCTCSCHNNPGVALNCCPTQKGFAQITVTAIKATGLWGDYFKQTDGYVKLLRNGKNFLGQTSVIWNQNWPTWNWDFNLGTEDLTQFSSVKLEVWDRDSGWDDDLLGACTVKLKSGVEENFCALNHGTLYYKVQVKCVPGLSGTSCLEYKPSPMEAELQKVYVSRHARLIPRGMLLQMGVLLDERLPRFNQSNIRKATGFEL
ncbi:perforin-1-like isoform X1 [Ictalurus furcatus]|uniref:perforin-1-like isoform X1 n=2 Tax=Ictalurus furcatus TaxID=66913 RepID=UPI002350427A|nr:perforin-1-like isoform X1 [Ictalurus furcatus]